MSHSDPRYTLTLALIRQEFGDRKVNVAGTLHNEHLVSKKGGVL